MTFASATMSDGASFERPFGGVLRVRPRLGFLFVLTIPICAALAAVKEVTVAGFEVPLYLLGFILLASCVTVLVEKAMNRDHHAGIAPFWAWIAWFGYVWLSLLWKMDLATRDIQFAMQLSLPLLVGMVASMFVTSRRQLDSLRRVYPVALVIIVVILLLQQWNLFGLLQTSARQTALTVALISAVFLAETPARVTRPLLGWGVCAAVCALTESRMALLIVLALPAVHPAYRRPLRRFGVLLAIGGLCIGLLYTSPVQQQLFPGGRGGVSDLLGGGVTGTGRFEAWPLIFAEAQERPVLGAGANASYNFVPTIWPGMVSPHNEYLRIGFEFGLVGLSIFLLVVVWQLAVLRRWIDRSHGSVHRAFTASFLGLVVLLIAACTDNPLGYSIGLGCPLFALIGAAHGVSRHEARASLHLSERL